ncbi:ribosomal protein S6 [Peptoniphilus sp. oral taxon 386 str. F0131]|nr:ribosomal protein S6 [Peptoniphilus sp. oral taxon 386 str. F0131]
MNKMNKYEAIVMFYPDVEEERRVSSFERLKGIIEENGTISNVDEWGMRKLAYEIEYYKEAYYYLVEFEAVPETVKEFDRVSKILDSVMRHMVVRLDK